MNLFILHGDWLLLHPLGAFLPLALAGCATFVVLSAQWLARWLGDQDQGSN